MNVKCQEIKTRDQRLSQPTTDQMGCLFALHIVCLWEIEKHLNRIFFLLHNADAPRFNSFRRKKGISNLDGVVECLFVCACVCVFCLLLFQLYQSSLPLWNYVVSDWIHTYTGTLVNIVFLHVLALCQHINNILDENSAAEKLLAGWRFLKTHLLCFNVDKKNKDFENGVYLYLPVLDQAVCHVFAKIGFQMTNISSLLRSYHHL